MRLGRAGVVLAAGAGYAAVSAVVWWHLLAHGLTHTIPASGYGDPDQDVWFLAWLPHALGHGLNPFVSKAMFAPKGINLVLNTSIFLPALVMTPITETLGPLVAFNVAVLLAPVLSATVAFCCFRRWAPFAPGRWLGGLLYGFSPFVLNDLMAGHLHLTVLVFPPVALVLLDDLVVRRSGRAVTKGGLLGLVLAAQFYTGQEVFAIMIMTGVCGLVILAIRHRHEVARGWRRAAVGLGVAGGVLVVLVGFAAYEMVAGPQRFSGTVFKVPYGYVIVLRTWLFPLRAWPQRIATTYVGIPLLLAVGLGCWKLRSGVLRFSVAMAGVALVFGLGGAVHWTPAVNTHIPLPDRIFSHWPLLKNLLPVRFAILVDLFLGLGLAIVVDSLAGDGFRSSPAPASWGMRRRGAGAEGAGAEGAGAEGAGAEGAGAEGAGAEGAGAEGAGAEGAGAEGAGAEGAGAEGAGGEGAGGEGAGAEGKGGAEERVEDEGTVRKGEGAGRSLHAGVDASHHSGGGGSSSGGSSGRSWRTGRRPALVATAIGIVCVLSPVLGAPIPFAVRPISVPAVYRSPALTHLAAGTVLLGYPVPNGFFADPIVWQAEEHMPYDMVAGYGFIPTGHGPAPTGQMLESTAYTAFQDAQVGLLPASPSTADISGLRSELFRWHVTVVVEYVGYGELKQPDQLAALVSAACGVSPVRVDGAWIWEFSSGAG